MWTQLHPHGAQPLPQFSAHVCCDQMAGWIKIPFGTKVGLGPGHIVLHGDPAPQPPIFGRCLLWQNGCPSPLLLSACNLPHLHLAPLLVVTPFESLAVVWHCLHDPAFSHFSRMPRCDGWMDRQIQWQVIPALASIVRVKTDNSSSVAAVLSVVEPLFSALYPNNERATAEFYLFVDV